MKDADGKTYVYSTSEPYFGNRIFPMFDQPNIKATYHLVCCAPDDWTVITNNILMDKAPAKEHNAEFFDGQE